MKNQHTKFLTLRALFMARATECNAIGHTLAASSSMQETCRAIEHSGIAKGLLEAVEGLDALMFAINAANDNEESA